MSQYGIITDNKLLEWSLNLKLLKQFTMHRGSAKKFDNLKGSARFFGAQRVSHREKGWETLT